MPHAWTRRRERQYQHIKKGSKERGVSEDRAKEIAARTVNKQRRESGETPNQQTMGTGNPNQDLEDRTKDELYNLAQEYGIAGRSQMRKEDLIKAIRSRH